jgi:hypothetical protein
VGNISLFKISLNRQALDAQEGIQNKDITNKVLRLIFETTIIYEQGM